MKPQTLFEALAEIADEHDAHDGGDDLLVVPVLTDELESRRDLLAEIAEFLGGVLLDLTTGAYDSRVPAYDDALLRAAVGQDLSFDRPGGGRNEVSITYSDGHVDAQLRTRGRLVTVPSPAEKQLIAIARALFDERLKDHEIALMLYDENAFDGQQAVLRTLTGLGRQSGLRLGTVRTLVPFIRSSGLDRERHCQLYRGVRYSLTDGHIVRRNRTQHLFDTVRRLTTPRDQPLVLFLGAGFSASSDMPIGNAVRNTTIRRICELPDIHDGLSDEQLAVALYRFANTPDRRHLLAEREKDIGEARFAQTATLEQAVRIEKEFLGVPVPRTISDLQKSHNERIEDPDFRFGDAVYALDRIIEAGRRVVLVTVNFDELVERKYPDALDIAVDAEDFERLVPILAAMSGGDDHPDGKIPLLKLHGTINRPETCVVTEAQTRAGITPPKAKALMAMVDDLPREHRVPWAYVGASMRDIDLDHIFGLHQFNTSVSEWWVAPWPEETVRSFVNNKSRWWVAEGDRLLNRTVTETADAFMSTLADRWV